MSAPVDVITVMTRSANALANHGSSKLAREGRVACAAMAELIEAAEQAHAFLCEKAPATATEFRLRTALASVGGAA
ncbi:hypothetical protein ACCQ10_09230 [Xanthomonas sp. NCPPB 1325]|uniref:hypothetical protein n=1 Tax=Xanthomonas sp. NCPPB 1325 TaxID=487529 RepID=UPI003555EC5A